MAVTSPADGSCPKSILALACWRCYIVIVTLFQMQVDLFDNELPLLVFLTAFVCPGIRPSYHALTPLAKDIIDTMKPSNQKSIFRRTDPHIHTVVEEVGTPCYKGMNSEPICQKQVTREIRTVTIKGYVCLLYHSH